ncbi:MAG: hypothetical protein D6729_13155 [Deltaproteobacteria bacterium]|nr:MAG: hypothetical protein D6729_13155 [Deltaproteobacteria bacterium]
MRPTRLSILLCATVPLCLACPAAGPEGPRGPKGTDGAPALARTVAVDPGAECPAGGLRLEAGSDGNGNGVLDATEITTSQVVCHGEAGPPGPPGPAARYQVESGDGFVWGVTTGFAGWLWNETYQGYLYMPEIRDGQAWMTVPDGTRILFVSSLCEWKERHLYLDFSVDSPPIPTGALIPDLTTTEGRGRLIRAGPATYEPPTSTIAQEMIWPDPSCRLFDGHPFVAIAGLWELVETDIPYAHPLPLTLTEVTP